MATALRLLGIGWFVALSILAGGFGGRWLDQAVDSGPLFTLLGLAAGLAVAIVGMYRMLTAVLSQASEPTDQGKG